MRLARVSLSPNSSSATATVSFSLMTEWTPQSSRRRRVLRAFKKRLRLLRSSRVSRICATVLPKRPNSWSYSCMRRLCPMAEAAWREGSSEKSMASAPATLCRMRVRPAATAPELTSTTLRPRSCSMDSWSTSRPMRGRRVRLRR
jgi:hypothetical protein